MIITDNVTDVAEIVRELSIEDIEAILREQIFENGSVPNFEKDNFMPMYSAYKEVVDDPLTEPDFKKKADLRFYAICNLFLELVADKFELSYDEDYFADNRDQLSNTAFFVYRFFILDIFSNTVDVLKTYIEEHADELSELFDEYKNKKDAATISSGSYVPAKYVTVVANIPEIIKYILSQLDVDTYLANCDEEDVVVEGITDLYASGNLGGNFIDKLIEFYNDDVDFRSRLVFDITFRLQLTDNSGGDKVD